MATIKFSEFDAGNISLAGTQLVGLSGGNSATNARFTAADLVNGLATITYVDSQDAGLQSQITQNTNDIAAIDTASIIANVTTLQGQVTVLQGNIVVLDGAVAALENNVSVNQDDIVVLQGNVIQIENELANIADTDNQTLSYDGATANLSISNGNNVVLQEVLDNAGNITVIQGQIADLQANGNIQLLSLDNSSNVLSISGGNTVDFTTVLGNVAGGTAGTLQEVTDAGNTTVTNITVADVTSTGNICVGTGIGGAITGAISISSESLIATSNLTVAGFLVDGIIDDDTLATASATTLATSESIKAYVDASSQTLSLNNSSNVLTISDGNTVDFTTVLGSVAGGGGLAAVVDDTSPELGGELNDGGFGIVMENGSPIESGIVFTNGSGTTFAKIETRPDSGDFVILGDDHNLVLRSFQDVELVTANDLKLKGLTWPASDGSAGQVLVTDGAGTLSFGTGGGGGNPFDQNLDTTDSPTFDNLSTTGELDVNGSGTHTFEGTLEFTQLSNFGGSVGITALLDEDDMVSDSATALATQQSIKAYVDAKPLSGVAIGPGLVTEPTAGDQGIGMGDGADAALKSIAIGLGADATGTSAIAIGEGATAGLQSVALGLNADASQNYVTAIGWDAVATGPGATALGHECEATGAGAIAVGSDSTATSTASLAIGYKSDVQAPYGTSIGWQNDLSSAATYTVSIGNYVSNNTYTQPDAIKVCAGSTYQTQLEVRPDYLDISSDNFGIACNASVGFTFTDAINGNVTLTSLIGGGGGGNYSNANVTAYAEAGWTGNIIPSANITYDLGSETNRWKDLWLSGNTIHLGDTSISAEDGTLSVDGLDLENTYATTSSIVNTATEVYNSNGILPADPKGMAVADPNAAGGWYWSSPGPGASPIGLNSFQWRMFNNNGPQTYTVADIDYMYMIVDLYTVGQVYFNIYTGTGPIPTTFTSRFSFTLNGDFANTGRFLMWAKPPGSSTTVDDVEVYPFLERLELPYAAVASSGPLLTSEPIKSLNVQTRTSPALTAGEVEFNLKNVGYKVKGGYIQNFDMDIYNPFDQGVSTTDTPEFQGVTATTGTVRLASLTTTERDTTLTAVDGDMIYNTTDSKLQGYQAGGWINLDGS